MTTVKNEDLLTALSLKKGDSTNIFQYGEVIHGTYFKVLDLIMNSGLCKMQRTNIHMGIGLPGKDGCISGMRSSCEVVVEVNLN